MQNRTVIDYVQPQLNNGRFPVRRVVGEPVKVTATIFGDGHDYIRAVVEYKKAKGRKWEQVEMTDHGNDAWSARFECKEQGTILYRVVAWIDHLKTWYSGFKKKYNDGQDMSVELKIGANFLNEIANKAKGAAQKELNKNIQQLGGDYQLAVTYVLSEAFADLLRRYPLRQFETTYDHDLKVIVGRKRERFSSWYELFPRSASPDIDRPGTFKDVEKLLPRIQEFGFDVLYMPPVHPVGHRNRKGRNNAVTAMEGEPGSPWAIGSKEGGHKAILPALGDVSDYKNLIDKARDEFNIDVALDLAFQCAPDHPYVEAHPEWFIWRPDGTVMYAENPPKKYQDIVPINFETADWKALWKELLSVVLHWCKTGITIFRVDVYTDWCGWCKQMDKKTFGDPVVAAYVREHFYAVKLDAEMRRDLTYDGHRFFFDTTLGRRGAHTLAYALLEGRMSYPSIVYLDEYRDRISISPGFKTADKYIKELRFIEGGHYRTMTFQEYLSQPTQPARKKRD